MKKAFLLAALALSAAALITACGGESEDEKIERLTNACVSAFERDMMAMQNNSDCKELMKLGVDIERRMR